MNRLSQLGWTDSFAAEFVDLNNPSLTAARVSREHRDRYEVLTANGALWAEITGRFRHLTTSREEFPVVGDWVAVDVREAEGAASIHALLPRRSALVRKVADQLTEAQVLAANVDTAFIVTSANDDFNLRRLERFLTLVWESGASPVIVLSKVDLCEDTTEFIDAIETIAVGVPVHAVSAVAGVGLDALSRYVGAGRTVVLIGTSGVGKSTLTNHLVGSDVLVVNEIREDDARGRHTTSHRELVELPDGGVLIDTPGLREVALWTSEEGFGETFTDIEALAESCKFGDCSHGREPGCAVLAALDDGTLDEGRYQSYLKLRRELAYLERRQDVQAKLAERRKWKAITVSNRKSPRLKP